MAQFKEYFGNNEETFTIETIVEAEDSSGVDAKIEKIRKMGIKVKALHPTRFGFELVFYNELDAKDAAKATKTKKIDGKSIFLDK